MTSGDVIGTSTLMGGRQRWRADVVDYDHAWPTRYASERDHLVRALGPQVRRIDHVGATSVPGLAAEPVVDVLVQVRDAEDEFAYAPPLLRAGYRVVARVEGHRLLHTPERDVRVHVCGAGSELVYRQLVLRDWLRLDATDRRAYEELVRRTAHAPDREHLLATFEAEATSRAEAWALATY